MTEGSAQASHYEEGIKVKIKEVKGGLVEFLGIQSPLKRSQESIV